MTFRGVTLDLLHRYNVPGPRYTSYPTAPVWKEDFGPAEYESILGESAGASSAPLSLYVHLPFCESLCYFCACTVVITGNHSAFDEYFAEALERLSSCAEDGLVELTREEIRATSLGRVFLRNLAMPFDAYLDASAERPVFSRTL